MKYFGLVLYLLFIFDSSNQDSIDNEVMIIGVNHFLTFGKGGVENIDFESNSNLKALKSINDKIVDFSPNEIFVEIPLIHQASLDSAYKNYQESKGYQDYNSEIHKIAFESGARLKLNRITGVDINPGMFPMSEILKSLNMRDSIELYSKIEDFNNYSNDRINNIICNNGTIEDILCEINSDENLLALSRLNNSLLKYNYSPISIRTIKEWYSKHLEIWSLIQDKSRHIGSNRIIIIYGASHVSIFKSLIKKSDEWKLIDFCES